MSLSLLHPANVWWNSVTFFPLLRLLAGSEGCATIARALLLHVTQKWINKLLTRGAMGERVSHGTEREYAYRFTPDIKIDRWLIYRCQRRLFSPLDRLLGTLSTLLYIGPGVGVWSLRREITPGRGKEVEFQRTRAAHARENRAASVSITPSFHEETRRCPRNFRAQYETTVRTMATREKPSPTSLMSFRDNENCRERTKSALRHTLWYYIAFMPLHSQSCYSTFRLFVILLSKRSLVTTVWFRFNEILLINYRKVKRRSTLRKLYAGIDCFYLPLW